MVYPQAFLEDAFIITHLIAHSVKGWQVVLHSTPLNGIFLQYIPLTLVFRAESRISFVFDEAVVFSENLLEPYVRGPAYGISSLGRPELRNVWRFHAVQLGGSGGWMGLGDIDTRLGAVSSCF